jgi:hypothetical protein
MTLPLVPFEGRMSYCLIKSLQMVLAYQGHTYALPWLECVSGEAFEFVYVRDEKRLFAVIGDRYHIAGEHLLCTLNYSYTYTGSSDGTTALAVLEDALRKGPVVAGMLDMGYLSYIPYHQSIRGTDHAVVVLGLRPDGIIVHDPAGFVAVSLPLSDFLAAWQRDVYTGKPYGLWQIGEQGNPPSDEEIWERTLARARENFARTTVTFPDGIALIYGPDGMRTLAADLVAWPERDLGSLANFSWQVSAQRCLDTAFFLRERLPQAAAIRWEECQIYGQLQQASAANERARLPELLERLAEREERFVAALG